MVTAGLGVGIVGSVLNNFEVALTGWTLSFGVGIVALEKRRPPKSSG